MVPYIMSHDIFFLNLSVSIDQFSYLSDWLYLFFSLSLSLEHKFLIFTFYSEHKNDAQAGDHEKNLTANIIFIANFNLKSTVYIYLTQFINLT